MRAALCGLQPAQITEQCERHFNWRVVTSIVDGYRRFDIVLRLPEAQRTTVGLAGLLLEIRPGGGFLIQRKEGHK